MATQYANFRAEFLGWGRPDVPTPARGGPQGPLGTHNAFGGFEVLGKFLRRRVTNLLTSLNIFRSDSSNKEDAIEDEEEEEDDDEEEEDDDLEVKEENGVLVLNDVNFDNFVADKDTVLLEFYAPW